MNSNVKDQAPAIRIIGDEVVVRMALDKNFSIISVLTWFFVSGNAVSPHSCTFS